MISPRRLRFLPAFLVLITLSAGCAQKTEKSENTGGTLTAALWELAAGAEAANDYEKAASYYDRLYERHSDNKIALLGYSRNLRYLGLPKSSLKAIQAGLKKHGEDIDLTLELGKSQLAAALINDARETLERALTTNPERWEAHSTMGIIFDRLQQFDKAQTAYRKALSLSPENLDVQNNLALSLAQSGQLDAGIAILKKIVESENSTPQSRQNLSMLYGLKGELEKANVLAKLDLPPNMAASNIATFKQLHAKRDAPMLDKPVAIKPPIPQPKVAKRPPQIKPPRKVEQRGAEGRIYVSVGSANVRKGPSTRHPPVAFLQQGHKVRLLGKSTDGRWSHIVLEDGRQGYVFHKLIRRQ